MSDPNKYEMPSRGQLDLHEPGYGVQTPKFSTDELRVLKECNRESFYQRSLPLSTAMGFGTYMCIKNGYFKASPRFGAVPKVTMAVMVGYFIGKVSYQKKCAEKLMELPGSYIGQLLRDKKSGKFPPPPQSPSPPITMFGAGLGDIYSDAGPGNSLNLDTDRPSYLNESDAHHPDDGKNEPESNTIPRPAMSYDDLRKKNRSDFTEARQDPYRIDPALSPPISRARPSAQPQPNMNKYGDAME